LVFARRLGRPLDNPPEARKTEPFDARAQDLQEYLDENLQNDCEDFGHDLSSEIRVPRPMLFDEESRQLPRRAGTTVAGAAPKSAA